MIDLLLNLRDFGKRFDLLLGSGDCLGFDCCRRQLGIQTVNLQLIGLRIEVGQTLAVIDLLRQGVSDLFAVFRFKRVLPTFDLKRSRFAAAFGSNFSGLLRRQIIP